MVNLGSERYQPQLCHPLEESHANLARMPERGINIGPRGNAIKLVEFLLRSAELGDIHKGFGNVRRRHL